MKNTKVQKCKRCENVKSDNRIIQKMLNRKKVYAAFENNICKQKHCFYLYNLVEKII